ncbi:transporter [Wenyingzhuangia sp. 2_MG-2023]|uniref:transporter n=1 Tax=Wenyingzhuangia sp. 2_MG-2023 TaxID=3062639 RepID=UPI0026E300BA|nr:transporter [Wenyingzhuangia sp. 2_MG-2023]MDO6738605.1 transporter [Wenyingzhuangia sp. 2_MG-2023]
MQTLIKIFFTLLLIINSTKTYACDVCGCGSSNSSSFANVLGGNYVGFSYNYMYFQYIQNYSDSDFPLAKDHVNTVSISGQYQITDKVQINATVPYRFNNRYKASGDVSNSGMGDVSVYGLINLLHADSNHSLKLGAGLKMPTGDFDLQNSSLNKTSAAQLGTGSWDVLLPLQYNYNKEQWSVNVSAMYFLKGKNDDDFKYGNQTQVNVNTTYVFPVVNNFSLAPIVGLSYDYFLASERFDIVDNRTKGYMTNANIGVQMETKKLILGINTQLPIAQNLIENEVTFNQGIGVYTYWKF